MNSGIGDYKIMVLPDHPTPISIRTHTREPVPFGYLFLDRKCRLCDRFDEFAAKRRYFRASWRGTSWWSLLYKVTKMEIIMGSGIFSGICWDYGCDACTTFGFRFPRSSKCKRPRSSKDVSLVTLYQFSAGVIFGHFTVSISGMLLLLAANITSFLTIVVAIGFYHYYASEINYRKFDFELRLIKECDEKR